MECPICQKPSTKAFEPFCSALCKNIDLLRWLKGDYRIPQSDDESEESLTPEDNDETFDK